MAKDFKSIDEIGAVIASLDDQATEVFNDLKNSGVTAPQIMVRLIVEEQHKKNMIVKGLMLQKLQEGNVVVFLPLPPYIIDEIKGFLSKSVVIQTEKKIQAHLRGINYVDIRDRDFHSISQNIRDITTVVLDGKLVDHRLVIRKNIAGVINSMAERRLKTIFIHRISHFPRGEEFISLALDTSRLELFWL